MSASERSGGNRLVMEVFSGSSHFMQDKTHPGVDEQNTYTPGRAGV